MQRRRVTIGMAVGVLALAIAGLCFAQPQAGGNRANRGERGAGGNFDPAQMRQRMMERWKEQLGADDESWKVIEPRLTKVMELSRDNMGGRGGMFGGMGMRGGPGGQGGRGGEAGNRPRFPGEENRQPTAVEKAAEALSATLENQSASAETIKQQLTALRAARVKAQQDLATAQQDLRQLLTVKQEAILVLNGTLN